MKRLYPDKRRHLALRHLAIFVVALIFSTGPLAAQTEGYTLTITNGTLEEAFDRIERQGPYRFMFNPDVIDVTGKVTVDVAGRPLDELLAALFKNTGIAYQLSGNQIVLSRRPGAASGAEGLVRQGRGSSGQSGSGRDVQGQGGAQPQSARNEITGTVTDYESGEAMPWVTVYIRRADGSIGSGTATDANGRYSLTTDDPAGDLLVVSYVGYKPAEERIHDRRAIDVALKQDITAIDPVVVTGYQTLSQERSTGAFEIVNQGKLDRKIFTNATEALEGQAAGVSTYKDKVVIRGINTFSSSIGNEPLLVIDGLPTERSLNDINMNDVESLTVLKDAAAASIYGVRAANGVIVITTKGGKLVSGNDQSVTRIQFTADWRWTDNPSLGDYHLATSGELMDYEQLLIAKAARTSNLSEADYLTQFLKGIGEAGSSGANLSYYSPFRYARTQLLNGQISQAEYDAMTQKWRNTDYRREYMDQVWRTPFRQSYNISVNSSGTRQSTYASINFIGEDHRVSPNRDKYIKGYIKSTQVFNRWFSFDVGADIQYANKQNVDANYADFTKLEPYTSILDENGNRVYRDFVDVSSQTYTGSLHINPKILDQIEGLPQFMSYRFNILDELDDNRTTQNNYSLRSFVKFNFKIYEDLRFSSSFDYEFAKNRSETFMSKDSYYIRFLRNRFATNASTNAVIPAGGRMSISETSTNSWVWRNQLDYQKQIGSDHQITASAGIELRELKSHIPNKSVYYGYDPTALTYTLLNDKEINSPGYKQSYIYNNNTGQPGAVLDGNYVNLADNDMKPSLGSYNNRYVGMYAVGGYTYKNRYGISASVRVDQANLFGTDPKYRYRPLWSVGLKWNAAKESFLSDVQWIDMLDVRASYGVMGNVDQTTTPYLVARMYNQSNFTAESIPYTSITSPPNPLLRWEKTSSYNAGVDFMLLDGTLSGKFDLYFKKSEDLLGTIEVPFTSGYRSQKVNSGQMKNRGVEFTLSSPWYRQNGWTLTSTLMLSYNKNTVTRAYYKPTQASHLTMGGYLVDGKPFNAVYAYRYGGLTSDGTDQQNGVPIILRADGSTVHHYNDNGTLSLDASTSMAPEDVVYMGTGTPPWNGSFTQNIRYKGLELSAMLVYYGGHKVYVPSFNFYQTNAANDLSDWIGRAWSPENPTSTVPKAWVHYDSGVSANNIISLVEMYQRSTANIKNGDFIRLRNVALSYTLPQKYTRMLKLEKIRVTAQVNNPWFWSAAGNKIDPETLSGVGSWTLPTATSWFLRFDITF